MIGLFDSGSGGLTVLKALREKAPEADVVYFGDIANAPYGVKSAEELEELTRRGVDILRRHGAKVLVSACNSVSTSVLAGAAGTMPFVEMSLPTAAYLRTLIASERCDLNTTPQLSRSHLSDTARFLLIATPATINSKLYEKALHGNIELDSLPIPDLAGAIEFGEPADKIEKIIEVAFSSRQGESYDGLILGCTHYPFVREQIEMVTNRYFGNLRIIDPAEPVAAAVSERFAIAEKGTTQFLISKESEIFEEKVRRLFPGSTYSIKVLQPLQINAVLV